MEGLYFYCAKSNYTTNKFYIKNTLKTRNRKSRVAKVCILSTFIQTFENSNVQQITDNLNEFIVNKFYPVFSNECNFDDKIYAVLYWINLTFDLNAI